ncbi:DUF2213 domain-containing protein [Vibrio harveyi]|uniref:DUF2213 domain-containing protein n=1 Tax=Vibrio harveyi TaxID=669 RepID=UPI003BB7A2E1
MSNRKVDVNGFVRIEGNPISKVGIFDYLGRSLGPEYEQDRIYKVFRSESALNNPETIESFKNIPWIDEHEMLGPEETGLTPAEKKGVQGTTGEKVYFDYPYLRANLNIFSEFLGELIESDKKELSPGYRCKYIKCPGTFEGENYDVIQVNILGNHLATVFEGRTGPDVAVLDHTFTLDSKDLLMDGKDKKPVEGKKNAPESSTNAMDEGMQTQVMDMVTEALPGLLKEVLKPMVDEMMQGATKPDGDKTTDEDEPTDSNVKSMDAAIEKALGKFESALDEKLKPVIDRIDSVESSAMDAAEAKEKKELADRVSVLIGTFDHSGMSLEKAQDYALEKFGLDATDKTPEQKSAMIDVYLQTNTSPRSAKPSFGADSAEKVNFRKYNQGAN